MIAQHLNKFRWMCLTIVFLTLLFIPFASIYQNYQAAHAYDLLSSNEKFLFDTMELLTDPFIDDAKELDFIKGSTWTANIAGWKISDPLAALSQLAILHKLYLPFLITAALPVLITLIFGRVFCGWLCPATFLYELNTNFTLLLHKLGLPVAEWTLDRRIKYYVLLLGLIVTAIFGLNLLAATYPPAILGKEIYYAIALDGFSTSAIFFLATLMLDIGVSRRAFCRYLCPGGALYSLLGRYRVVRIQRDATACNDCYRCNGICEFGLQPMQDSFGMECNNCTACVAICPSKALKLTLNIQDRPYQGPGHLGKNYQKSEQIIVTDVNHVK